MTPKRFEIRISSRARTGSLGELPSGGSRRPAKTLFYRCAVLVVVSAALVVGLALGTTVALIIVLLISLALALLLAQNALNRFRLRRSRPSSGDGEL